MPKYVVFYLYNNIHTNTRNDIIVYKFHRFLNWKQHQTVSNHKYYKSKWTHGRFFLWNLWKIARILDMEGLCCSHSGSLKFKCAKFDYLLVRARPVSSSVPFLANTPNRFQLLLMGSFSQHLRAIILNQMVIQLAVSICISSTEKVNIVVRTGNDPNIIALFFSTLCAVSRPQIAFNVPKFDDWEHFDGKFFCG